jgi:hypothetical protein
MARLLWPVPRSERQASSESAEGGEGAAGGVALRTMREFASELGQLTRDLVRLNLESRAGETNVLLEHNRRLAAQVDQYEKRRIDLYEAFEEALSQKQMRELETRKAVLDEKRHQYLADRLDMLMPLALNRFLGGGPGKGAPAGTELARSLLGSMSPQQVDAMLTGQPFSWTREQTSVIAELYMSFAEQEKVRQSARGQQNGATGGTESVKLELDAGLPESLMARVLTALGSERDASVLENAARELEAQYPLSAAALKRRAEQLRGAGGSAG